MATFVRDTATPCRAEDGLSRDHCSVEEQIGCYVAGDEFTDDDLAKLDGEGRCVITEHQIRLVQCLYLERLTYAESSSRWPPSWNPGKAREFHIGRGKYVEMSTFICTKHSI